MRLVVEPIKSIAVAGIVFLSALFIASPAPARQAAGARGGPPTPAEMKGKTAGEVYKNIKVLNNVPADQVIDGMRYITIALGVDCDFCHNTKDFPSDQKRTKKTARNMMSMLFAINKEDFEGRPVVGCYTCHQGHERPIFAPMPGAEADKSALPPAMTMVEAKKINSAPGTPLPTVDEVLAKYAQALGGEAALASVSTREIVLERTGQNENLAGLQETISEKAPNKFLVVTQAKNRSFRVGYNGKVGWVATPQGPRSLDVMDGLVPSRDAAIDPPAALSAYKAKPQVGMAQIGDQKAYVVTAQTPDRMAEQLYFDTGSGLLLRRTFIYRTIFGPLLFQANYSQYRKAGNVEIPFQIEWWAAGNGYTETVKSVRENVPIDDAEFQPPKAAAMARPATR